MAEFVLQKARCRLDHLLHSYFTFSKSFFQLHRLRCSLRSCKKLKEQQSGLSIFWKFHWKKARRNSDKDIANEPVHVENVSFAYEEEEPIIENVSFDASLVKWLHLQDLVVVEKRPCSVYWNDIYEPTAGRNSYW